MSAQSVYSHRAEQAETALEKRSAQYRQTWGWLLAAGVIGILPLVAPQITAWATFASILIAMVVLWERMRVSKKLHVIKRRMHFYRDGLTRLVHQQASAGDCYRDASHLYTNDLNVFGSGSIFSLLCTARTGAGQNTLAAWLRAPASIPTVRARQEAVEELRSRVDLRESIALLDAGRTRPMDPAALSHWLDRHVAPFPWAARIAAGMVVTAAIVTGIFALAGALTKVAFLVSLAPEIILAGVCYHRVRIIVESISLPALDLGMIAQLLLILEREFFTSPLLKDLQLRLKTAGLPASTRVKQLRRLANLLNLHRVDVSGYLSPILLWCTQFAMAIEAWRSSFGADLRGWLAAAGEFEALNSIAGYAFEHPGDPFPELLDTPQGVFEAESLGHPLIAEEKRVRNHAHLNPELQVIVVSGSNMSGKSTYLRAIGLNTVLAWAGAPVCARRLRLSRLDVGAAIQVEDSLEHGQSRFAAEVLRLRKIMDLTAGETPVLFLLDEVLSGTNSRDRRIGAEAIVRYLMERGAIGLITTHDLSLTEIAEILHPRAANIFFEDSFVDGRMIFDYQARPGVLSRSNAIAVMRSLGIEA